MHHRHKIRQLIESMQIATSEARKQLKEYMQWSDATLQRYMTDNKRSISLEDGLRLKDFFALSQVEELYDEATTTASKMAKRGLSKAPKPSSQA